MISPRLPDSGTVSSTLSLEFDMKIIALVMLCTFSSAALAQTSECRSIHKSSARLACYDKASPPITTPASAPSPLAKGSNARMDGYVDPLGAENARLDAKMKNICRGC
jgi:hypothetical protein